MPQVEYDRFDIKSKYSIEGILPKPMTGDFSFSVLDAKFHGNGSVLLYKKDGVEYFEIEDAKLSVDRLKLGNIKLTLPNGMNMKVGPIVSSILNVNDGILFRMLLKASKGKIDEAHANFKNSFIKDLPVSYIFSDWWGLRLNSYIFVLKTSFFLENGTIGIKCNKNNLKNFKCMLCSYLAKCSPCTKCWLHAKLYFGVFKAPASSIKLGQG